MGWNPFKDIRDALSDLDDSINQNVFDDLLGIESVGNFTRDVLSGQDPFTASMRSNKQRIGAKVDRARARAADQIRQAEDARNLPYILANQALSRRRRRMRDQSLMSGAMSGDTLLSSVAATGKNSLGA